MFRPCKREKRKEEQKQQQTATNKFLARIQHNSLQVQGKKPEFVLKQMNNTKRQQTKTTITLA